MVCFNSHVDDDSAKLFLAALDADNLTVVLDSGGGVAAALTMAEAILLRHASVIVTEFCLSACANYLFSASAKKYVLEGGYVGFHGGPPATQPGLSDSGHRSVRDLNDRAHRFYADIGVDSGMIYHPPDHSGYKTSDQPDHFWEYGPTTLATRFGVKGIRYFATPAFGWLAALSRRLSGISCAPTGADAWLCRF